jgi:tRNA 2-thiouridine synthesizing protein E
MSEFVKVIDGVECPLDEDGFLQEPDLWSEKVAEDFAKDEGIDSLTDDHWKVINYLREYYLKNKIAPMVRRLCKETGFNVKQIYELFPSGPAKGACKLAGLPKPTGCV